MTSQLILKMEVNLEHDEFTNFIMFQSHFHFQNQLTSHYFIVEHLGSLLTLYTI